MKSKYNLWHPFIFFGLIGLSVFAVLTLTGNHQKAKGGADNAGAPTENTGPMPNLNGAEATEYLKKQELYSSLSEAMQAARYSINPTNNAPLSNQRDALKASNPRQGFTTYFAGNGIHLVSNAKNEKWRVEMNLEAYGYGEELVTVEQGKMEVQKDKSRIEIEKAAVSIEQLAESGQQSKITEWYQNSANGLEQGWTIAEKPSVNQIGEPLRLAVKLGGNLKAKLATDGQSVNFIRGKNEGVLRYDKLRSWDADGKELESRMELKKGQLLFVVNEKEANYPITIDPFFTQTKKLTASDAAAGDNFGFSVAISGDTAIVGADQNDDGGTESGSAYIFERNTGGANIWGEVKKLTASDAAAFDFFGYSVSISGDTAIVGAWGNSDAGSLSGSAYIFERNTGGADLWGEVKKLTASDAANGDGFGISVAISGDTAIAGSAFDDDAGSGSGSAYIFRRNTGGADFWGQSKKITASDGANGDFFGRWVAISEDTAIVGAFSNDDAGGDSGSAYIFERNTGGADLWGQVKKLTASDAAAGDNFGWSVGISGDTAIVGALGNDDAGPNSGSAYIFDRNTGSANNWGQLKKLAPSDAAAGDNFGRSVAILGDTVIVGADADDAPITDSGSAYIFERNTGSVNNWGQVQKLSASDAAMNNLFGRSVAISVDTAIVGADSNSAYIFTDQFNNWQQISKPVSSDGTATDQLGISVAISGDTAIVGANLDDDVPNESGSAYIFERNTGGANIWGQVRKLTASDAAASDNFGISVAISGDKAIVGAYFNDDSGSDSGSAYIFERNAGGANLWGEVKKLTASDAAARDNFGFSVAISGDTAIVGAYLDDAPASSSGSAYIFERNTGGINNWGEVKKLTASDAALGDIFGISVSISGDKAIVGAAWKDGSGTESGSAYIFERNTGGINNWGEVKKLTASDAAGLDHFGESVALSGNKAIVGAHQDDDGGSNSGSAYIFERNTGGINNWGEVKKLTASDAAGGDNLGYSVAISGDTAVVGAFGNDDAGGDSGSAYVYERNTGGTDNWGGVKKLTASDAAGGDQFGFSVSMSGETAIVGSYLDDVTALGGFPGKNRTNQKSDISTDMSKSRNLVGADQGSAYVFNALASPTAAFATVAGRVTTNTGQGISRVLVSITGLNGNVISTQTNQFGYFNFEGIAVGETYVVSVIGKEHLFSPESLAIIVNEDITAIQFIGFEQ